MFIDSCILVFVLVFVKQLGLTPKNTDRTITCIERVDNVQLRLNITYCAQKITVKCVDEIRQLIISTISMGNSDSQCETKYKAPALTYFVRRKEKAFRTDWIWFRLSGGNSKRTMSTTQHAMSLCTQASPRLVRRVIYVCQSSTASTALYSCTLHRCQAISLAHWVGVFTFSDTSTW